MDAAAPTPKMHHHAPVFVVPRGAHGAALVAASAAYYHAQLGFSDAPLWGEPPCFAMPKRDGCTIMLSQGPADAVSPNSSRDGVPDDTWDSFFWCSDADALHATYRERGVSIVYPPVDRPYYGMREFAVRDLDGYVLCFGHDLSGEGDG